MDTKKKNKIKNRIENGATGTINLSSLGLRSEDIPQVIAIIEEKVGLDKVVKLNLSENRLGILPEAIASFKNLQDLELQSTQLQSLPEFIGKLTKLEKLDVAMNKLKTLPESIRSLTSLKQLDSKLNKLESLPESIGSLKLLTKLNLLGNVIKSLPESIGELTELRELYVSNKLKSLPTSIGSLKKLEKLDLEGNELAALPESMGTLEKLKELKLGNNLIESLPESIGSLQEITNLDLKGNKLTSVPESLIANAATVMRNIDLRTNPLSEETIDMIDGYTNNAIKYTRPKEPLYLTRLKQVYATDDSQATDMATFIKGLTTAMVDVTSFINDPLTHKEQLVVTPKPQSAVLKEFLEKAPDLSHQTSLNTFYKETLKHLVNEIKNTTSLEGRTMLITSLGTAIGNCATPVKDFLFQKGMGVLEQLQQVNPVITNTLMDAVMAREALEKEIVTQLREPLQNEIVEQIELIQGLTNAVFLEKAEEDINNKIPISGDRYRLDSKTEHIEFAFNRVTEDIKEPFTALCCKTEKNKPVVAADGSYVIDSRKLEQLTASYKKRHGISTLVVDQKQEKLIQEFKETYQKELQSEKFSSLVNKFFDREDVQHLLNVKALESALRNKLSETPEKELEDSKEQFTASRIHALEQKMKVLQQSEIQRSIDEKTSQGFSFEMLQPQNSDRRVSRGLNSPRATSSRSPNTGQSNRQSRSLSR